MEAGGVARIDIAANECYSFGLGFDGFLSVATDTGFNR